MGAVHIHQHVRSALHDGIGGCKSNLLRARFDAWGIGHRVLERPSVAVDVELDLHGLHCGGIAISALHHG
eukprot:2923413-Prymnesium_polylepis.1